MNTKTINVLEKFKGKNTNVHFADGRIYFTDGENYAGLSTPLAAGLNCAVPLADFKALLKRGVPEEIKEKEGKVEFRIGTKVFTFAKTEKINLPDAPLKTDKIWSIDKDFKSLKTFTANDAFRPIKSGVHFSDTHKEFVATDLHRMKWIEAKVDLEQDVVIGPQIFNVPEGDYINVQIEDGRIYLEKDDVFFYVRLIDEKYVDYKVVIPPHSDRTFCFVKKDLDEILADALICASKEHSGVVIAQTNGQLVISAEDVEESKSFDSGPVAYSTDNPEEFGIRLNAKLCLEILKSEVGEEVTIATSTPTRPILINGNVLLMPSRKL